MKRIIISRTDAIGDVVLTLPLAGIIKKYFPGVHVIFFGRNYTEPIISMSSHVDQFINYVEFELLDEKGQAEFLRKLNADAIIHVFPRTNIAKAAKKADIATRIGTSHRLYHWFTCNRLLNFSRKKSELHEAQLNTKLLAGLGIKHNFSLNELASYYGLLKPEPLDKEYVSFLSSTKLNVVIHPRSHGSAREWGLENFRSLINLLHDKVNILITGSPAEKEELAEWMTLLPQNVNDLTGSLSLSELISLLYVADGIVAGSTGPLHISAALGRYALGIFPPIRPMHAGRWAPVGINAQFVSFPKDCNDCRSNPASCRCIKKIEAMEVADLILQWK